MTRILNGAAIDTCFDCDNYDPARSFCDHSRFFIDPSDATERIDERCELVDTEEEVK